MISFYEVKEQTQIKNLLSGLLKLVVSQRLLKSKDDSLVMIPEVMIVDNIIGACIRKDKFNIAEFEDAIQSGSEKGSVSLTTSLAKAYVEGRLTLDMVKSQVDQRNLETLNRTIAQLTKNR